MNEDQNQSSSGLTFTQFKDWAFLGIVGGLISILIAAIYDLDKSVKTLSDRLSEKSGEITVILDQQKSLDERVTSLEREGR
jgi:hypothetical protein